LLPLFGLQIQQQTQHSPNPPYWHALPCSRCWSRQRPMSQAMKPDRTEPTQHPMPIQHRQHPPLQAIERLQLILPHRSG
jgi:hypothetical protein